MMPEFARGWDADGWEWCPLTEAMKLRKGNAIASAYEVETRPGKVIWVAFIPGGKTLGRGVEDDPQVAKKRAETLMEGL